MKKNQKSSPAVDGFYNALSRGKKLLFDKTIMQHIPTNQRLSRPNWIWALLKKKKGKIL